MNEPYAPTTPRPTSTRSSISMKILICFLSVFIVAQTIGTALFCLYFHMQLDKLKDGMSLNEDFLFLRRLHECQKPEGVESSLLDCKKITDRLKHLLMKEDNTKKDTETYEKLKGFSELLWHDDRRHVRASFSTGATPACDTKTSGSKSHSSLCCIADVRRHPVAAHLAGIKKGNKSVPVLEWKTTGYAPTNDLISYKEGKLKVKKAGVYYIYAQVSFCTKPVPQAPFTVYIYLHLPLESDRLLLNGLNTHSSSDLYCGLQSTHVGGVFELRQGDVVFVNVTDSTLVNYNHGSTYFGMFNLN
ncbi:CD40 ligand [Alligator mississippiensis]|uniref:CD40 ligand n=1 Tax=Alligator mississippiensis TaxID=8496 RepID=UPI00287732D7|nr:CD40 ligand [Alligator mississippiensis]